MDKLARVLGVFNKKENLFSSVQNKRCSPNSHNRTIFNADAILIPENFIHQKCTCQAGSIT